MCSILKISSDSLNRCGHFACLRNSFKYHSQPCKSKIVKLTYDQSSLWLPHSREMNYKVFNLDLQSYKPQNCKGYCENSVLGPPPPHLEKFKTSSKCYNNFHNCRAQSGTGKTATFSISILQCLDTQIRETQALVLSPTRELAVQIQKVMCLICKQVVIVTQDSSHSTYKLDGNIIHYEINTCM